MYPFIFDLIILYLGLFTDEQTKKPKHTGEYKMAINDVFALKFGNNDKPAAGKTDKPKAQFWLNIGYTALEGTDDEKFISLPVGIPLDTQEPLPTNMSNEDFRAMRCAQNDLLAQLLAGAAQLEPGQETTINLQVQLRRVKGEAAPIAAGENKYALNLNL